MNHDPKSEHDPNPFGHFSPEELTALRKHVRMRLAGVSSLDCQPPGNLTNSIVTFDDEGNVISDRNVTDEEYKRWEEGHHSLGLE